MTTRPALTLENFLCLDLYAASRAVMKAYTPLLAPLGLTYPQYLVMVALWQEDGQQVNALARQLSLDSGTLSPLLKRLEAAGLVERSRDTEDERAVKVKLTPSGRALQQQAPEVAGRIGDLFGMSWEEIQRLKTTLRAIGHRMEAGTGAPEKNAPA